MKLHIVEARYRKKVRLPDSLIKNLPKRVMLFMAVQFLDSLDSIKEQLKKAGVNAITDKAFHSKYEAQLLGCGNNNFEKKHNFDAFLYVGDGLFHPKALAVHNSRDIHIYNPFAKKHSTLDKKEIAAIKKRQKAALAKFYSSKNIGVIISLKTSQNRYADAKKLAAKYKDKTFYFLLFNIIEFDQLENFNFVECFVNTACPRLLDDYKKFPKPVVNLDEVI